MCCLKGISKDEKSGVCVHCAVLCALRERDKNANALLLNDDCDNRRVGTGTL